jgi:uncharacterized protein YdbL (DUF1318 family)
MSALQAIVHVSNYDMEQQAIIMDLRLARKAHFSQVTNKEKTQPDKMESKPCFRQVADDA